MNEILVKLEEMDTSDLIDIFEYLTDLINYKKEQEKLKKKSLKLKENLIKNFQAKCSYAQSVET